jgi:hypothetical protein
MTLTIAPPAPRPARVPAPRQIRRRIPRVYMASGAALVGIYALAATGSVSTGALTWAACSAVAVLAIAAALGAALTREERRR